MKDFAPASSPPPPAPAPSAAGQAARLTEAASALPEYEPAAHRFDWRTLERRRATIPLEIVEGIGMTDRERVVEMGQITIAENCTAMRLSKVGDDVSYEHLLEQGLRRALRKVGDLEGADLGDRELDIWLEKIGLKGYIYLSNLMKMLAGPSRAAEDLFAASKRIDLRRRRYSYTLPAVLVPPKRWAARTGLDCRWIPAGAEVEKSHWTVAKQAADEAQQLVLGRDLSFTMQQITVAQETSVADLVDDPDDMHATRIMQVMLSIVEIGGMAYGDAPTELSRKLAWLEDIGPRARVLVTGTYAQLHEVDKVELARFLEDSVPVE